jgi:hypothetical protein
MAESTRYLKKSYAFSSEKDEMKKELIQILFNVEPQKWLPISIFPRIHYEKEGKMKYAFEDFKGNKCEEFRSLCRIYLRSLNLKFLFLPPPDLCLKVSSSRFNDGGTVKRDFDRSTKPINSGFLYQKFNPKPLETREVWLPDRYTKISNTYWMLVGRQILKQDKTYPDDDPRVTWERIRHKLDLFGYFDMSGFGFQYPRKYLEIVAQTILELFYSNDLYEQLLVFQRILSKVVVQMPDGKFVYPPRGIGLGYYEDLKTIGVNAILLACKPISVYGDQGLVDRRILTDVVDRLRIFEFILKPGKYKPKFKTVKWSGWTMTQTKCERPKEYLSPLVAFMNAEFHWERKMILRSFATEYPQLYDRYTKYIPFLYETFFGYEFQKCDSLWNFSNGGVSSKTPRTVGLIKSAYSERLLSPKDTINDSLVYETPFYVEWKRADAKAFSIKRKDLYKKSPRNVNSFIVEYVNPIVRNNYSKPPTMTTLARMLSDSQESKLLVNYGLTSGKFSRGLKGDQLWNALRYNALSMNPYESYATGGYKVLTPWHRVPTVSSEWYSMTEHLLTNVTLMNNFIVSKFDLLSPDREEMFKRAKVSRPRSDSIEVTRIDNHSLTTHISKKTKLNRITLDMVNNMGDDIKPETQICTASTLQLDISARRLNLVDITSEHSCNEDQFDDDLYLDLDDL